MHNFGGWKSVEEGAAGGGISADVFRVEQITHFEIGKLFRQANGIQSVAGGAENRTYLRWALLKAFEMVLGVIENHAAIGVVDTVVQVVTELAVAHRLADDLGYGRRCGSH